MHELGIAMSSPFPGLNVYTEPEGLWRDLHHTFITYLREAIGERLPENYEARIDDRVVLEEFPEERTKAIEPNAPLLHSDEASTGQPTPVGGAARLEPIAIPLLMLDEPRQAFIEICRLPDRTLVTVLELLSPSNKSGPGRADYLAKRNALVFQDVHLVEFDLLLGGHRLPLLDPLPPGPFYAFVSRGDRRPDCDVYAWTLRQTLPTVPIPLHAPDPDIYIDLHSVFATAFERGRYARALAYDKPLLVSLNPRDREWIEERVAVLRAR